MKHFLIKLLTALFLGVLLTAGCDDSIRHQAETSLLTDKNIAVAKERFLQQAYEKVNEPPLIISATSPINMVDNHRTYVSLACYWWPNPDSQDGLPYIRRDGEVNPETRTEYSDLPVMIEMATRVQSLTTAYQISNDETFAAAAVDQLYIWFADQETAMLPHLEHAQMVKGRNSGRSYGVIDTWWLIQVVDNIKHLRHSEYWNQDLESDMKAWFNHYVNWLQNSEFGQEERRSNNNHGTWYDLQLVTFSMFAGQNDVAVRQLQNESKTRITRQIGFNGRQRHELRRPRPLHYSIYNLNGLLKLAAHGKIQGIDLINHSGFWGSNLKDAVNYTAGMMSDNDRLDLMDEHDQTDTMALYIELLMIASKLYSDPNLLNEAKRVLNNELPSDPSLIRIFSSPFISSEPIQQLF